MGLGSSGVWVCSASAGLQWTVARTGDWFYWSNPAPSLRDTESRAETAGEETERFFKFFFPGQRFIPSLARLSRNCIVCTSEAGLRSKESKITTECAEAHGAFCSTWYISHFSKLRFNLRQTCVPWFFATSSAPFQAVLEQVARRDPFIITSFLISFNLRADGGRHFNARPACRPSGRRHERRAQG